MLVYTIGYKGNNSKLVFRIYPSEPAYNVDDLRRFMVARHRVRAPLIEIFPDATCYCEHDNLCTKGKIYGLCVEYCSNRHIFYYIVE